MLATPADEPMLVKPAAQRYLEPCPECKTVPKAPRDTGGPCPTCGVLLLPGGDRGDLADDARDVRNEPTARTYKQDADGSWRLVFDPATGFGRITAAT